MYSEAEEHLVNLEQCGGREQRRAYLNVLLAVTAAGYRAIPRAKGVVQEMQIRDRGNRQPFALIINKASLLFYVRRPALDQYPGLPAEASGLFGEAVVGDANSANELRIRITTAADADRVTEWLFGVPAPAEAAQATGAARAGDRGGEVTQLLRAN